MELIQVVFRLTHGEFGGQSYTFATPFKDHKVDDLVLVTARDGLPTVARVASKGGTVPKQPLKFILGFAEQNEKCMRASADYYRATKLAAAEAAFRNAAEMLERTRKEFHDLEFKA